MRCARSGFNLLTSPLAMYGDVETISRESAIFGTTLVPEVSTAARWRERIALPRATGFTSLRVNVHAFEGSDL